MLRTVSKLSLGCWIIRPLTRDVLLSALWLCSVVLCGKCQAVRTTDLYENEIALSRFKFNPHRHHLVTVNIESGAANRRALKITGS